MNKKTLLVALCFLTGTTEVLARTIPLREMCTQQDLNYGLRKAAWEGDISKMRTLIAKGADVNSQEFTTHTGYQSYSQEKGFYDIIYTEQTILIQLLSRKEVDLDVLKFLINEAGANPNLKDSTGNNAFTLTADNIDQELHDILNGKTKTS